MKLISQIEAQSKNKMVKFSNDQFKIEGNSELWLEKYKPKKYDDLQKSLH